MQYKGKVAIITGGASGIGRAVGVRLARRGAAVILADIDGDLAGTAARSITARGGRAEAAALNVSDAAAFDALVKNVAREHGRCDYLFNNAGVSIAAEVRDMSLDDWNRIIDINLRGVIHGIHAAYPLMIRQGCGHIVNTASIAGLTPFPISAAYTATKHAVAGLSIALRAEAADLGVKVSVVCPGFIDTPMKNTIKSVNINKDAGAKALPFKLYPVDKCADDIIRGVSQNRAIITITPQADLLWMLYRISPEFYTWASAFAVKKSRTMREVND